MVKKAADSEPKVRHGDSPKNGGLLSTFKSTRNNKVEKSQAGSRTSAKFAKL